MGDSKLDEALQAMQRTLRQLNEGRGQPAGAAASPIPDRNTAPAGGLPASPPPVRPGAQSLPPLPPTDDRGMLLDWLIAAVRCQSGIAVEDQVRMKLQAVTDRTPIGALRPWLQALAPLDAQHPEWLALLESLTNHETYFFRDPSQLEALQHDVIRPLVARLRDQPHPRLTLWSAACSTGEEPYSVAMLLFEELERQGELLSGFRPNARWSIRIVATDLSRQALRTGRAATYEDGVVGSFRRMPDRFRRFLERVPSDEGGGGQYWRVIESVRRVVEFQTHNLMGPVPPVLDCDVVLCRNVMIYFDAAGKQNVWSLLSRALRQGGHALVGPTDIPPPNDSRFQIVWSGGSVLYRRHDPAA